MQIRTLFSVCDQKRRSTRISNRMEILKRAIQKQ